MFSLPVVKISEKKTTELVESACWPCLACAWPLCRLCCGPCCPPSRPGPFCAAESPAHMGFCHVSSLHTDPSQRSPAPLESIPNLTKTPHQPGFATRSSSTNSFWGGRTTSGLEYRPKSAKQTPPQSCRRPSITQHQLRTALRTLKGMQNSDTFPRTRSRATNTDPKNWRYRSPTDLFQQTRADEVHEHEFPLQSSDIAAPRSTHSLPTDPSQQSAAPPELTLKLHIDQTSPPEAQYKICSQARTSSGGVDKIATWPTHTNQLSMNRTTNAVEHCPQGHLEDHHNAATSCSKSVSKPGLPTTATRPCHAQTESPSQLRSTTTNADISRFPSQKNMGRGGRPRLPNASLSSSKLLHTA